MIVWFWRRLSVTYGARAAVGDTPGVEEGGLGRKAVGNSSDFSRDILRVCGRCSACGHSPPSVSRPFASNYLRSVIPMLHYRASLARADFIAPHSPPLSSPVSARYHSRHYDFFRFSADEGKICEIRRLLVVGNHLAFVLATNDYDKWST